MRRPGRNPSVNAANAVGDCLKELLPHKRPSVTGRSEARKSGPLCVILRLFSQRAL